MLEHMIKKHTILDLYETWHKAKKDEIPVQELCKVVAEKLAALKTDVALLSADYKTYLIDSFKAMSEDKSTTYDDFAYVWYELHNWAEKNDIYISSEISYAQLFNLN